MAKFLIGVIILHPGFLSVAWDFDFIFFSYFGLGDYASFVDVLEGWAVLASFFATFELVLDVEWIKSMISSNNIYQHKIFIINTLVVD